MVNTPVAPQRHIDDLGQHGDVDPAQDPQPKLDPDCDPQHADQGEGTSAGVKMPLPIRISRLTVAVQAKKKLDGAGVLLLALGVGEKVDRHQRPPMPKSPLDRPEMAEQTTAAECFPDGKAPVGKHEVERQYDQGRRRRPGPAPPDPGRRPERWQRRCTGCRSAGGGGSRRKEILLRKRKARE